MIDTINSEIKDKKYSSVDKAEPKYGRHKSNHEPFCTFAYRKMMNYLLFVFTYVIKTTTARCMSVLQKG